MNNKKIHLKMNICTAVKYCCILHGRIFVMHIFRTRSEGSTLKICKMQLLEYDATFDHVFLAQSGGEVNTKIRDPIQGQLLVLLSVTVTWILNTLEYINLNRTILLFYR